MDAQAMKGGLVHGYPEVRVDAITGEMELVKVLRGICTNCWASSEQKWSPLLIILEISTMTGSSGRQ